MRGFVFYASWAMLTAFLTTVFYASRVLQVAPNWPSLLAGAFAGALIVLGAVYGWLE